MTDNVLTTLLNTPGSSGHAWLDAVREKNKTSLLNAGLPTRKHERFKYADLSGLSQFDVVSGTDDEVTITREKIDSLRMSGSMFVVLVDGKLSNKYSALHDLPDGLQVLTMQAALTDYAGEMKVLLQKEISTNDYPFAVLNKATCVNGMCVRVANNHEIDTNLHIVNVTTTTHIHQPIQLFYMLGESSKLSVTHEYIGLTDEKYFNNVMTSVNAGANAKLSVTKLQRESKKAWHVENVFVEQKRDSQVRLTNIALGAAFSRDNVTANMSESNADCQTAGFYRADQHQYIDNHIDIQHVAPHTTSDMFYKGIASDKGKVVFNGKLLVVKDAQKINATQANHNLLLSNQAEVYSKPELEIYADDVKCKHGSTTGQLDQDALFYLRSRGVSRDEAASILLAGFAEEVLERIEVQAVRERARRLMEAV